MHKIRGQQGFSAVEAILTIVVLGILGFTGWFVYHSQKSTDKSLNAANQAAQSSAAKIASIKTFADCKKAAGSKVQETSPETCVTKAGKSFTDTSVQKYLVIKEWGVKLAFNDSVPANGLYTAPQAMGSSAPGVDYVTLASKDTLRINFTCGGQAGDGGEPVTHSTGDNPTHLLRAQTVAQMQYASNEDPKDYTHIGNYYYVYQGGTGFGDCGFTDAAVVQKYKSETVAYSSAAILPE
jgi:Tfp pilus assembly protein PilV